MKPPRSCHPTMALLFSLAGATVCFAIGLIVKLPAPLDDLFSLPGVGVGFMLGLLVLGSEVLNERTGGDVYLRRRVPGHKKRPFSARYSWLQLIVVALFIPLGATFGLLAVLGGLCLGLSAGYPYWRGRWERLKRVAEEEQQTASPANGGTA